MDPPLFSKSSLKLAAAVQRVYFPFKRLLHHPYPMLNRDNYRGLFAYPPTPFTESFELDQEQLRANLRKLIDLGVEGIVLTGTVGEGSTLSFQEFRRIAEILTEETDGHDVQAVMTVAQISSGMILEQCRLAAEIGLDGALVLAPFYTTLTRAELIGFWKALSRKCPTLGILVNHFHGIPQRYDSSIFEELANLPNIVGSKEAHWDFSLWREIHTQSPLVHMSATDIGWLPELYRHNAPGVGSVHFAYSPHIIQETIHCCNEGHFDAAERTLGPLTEFVSRIKYGDGEPHVFPSELNGWAQYSRMAKHKALTDAFGFLKAGPPRPPTIPVPQSLQVSLFSYIRRRNPELVFQPATMKLNGANLPVWRASKSTRNAIDIEMSAIDHRSVKENKNELQNERSDFKKTITANKVKP